MEVHQSLHCQQKDWCKVLPLHLCCAPHKTSPGCTEKRKLRENVACPYRNCRGGGRGGKKIRKKIGRQAGGFIMNWGRWKMLKNAWKSKNEEIFFRESIISEDKKDFALIFISNILRSQISCFSYKEIGVGPPDHYTIILTKNLLIGIQRCKLYVS